MQLHIRLKSGSTIDVEPRAPARFLEELHSGRFDATKWLVFKHGISVLAGEIAAVSYRELVDASEVHASEVHVWIEPAAVARAVTVHFERSPSSASRQRATAAGERFAAAVNDAVDARSSVPQGGGAPAGEPSTRRGSGTAVGGSLSGCTGPVFSAIDEALATIATAKVAFCPAGTVVVAANREQARFFLELRALPTSGPHAPRIITPHERAADGVRLDPRTTVLLAGWDRDPHMSRWVRYTLAKVGASPADCHHDDVEPPARGYYVALTSSREEIWAQGIPPVSAPCWRPRGVLVEASLEDVRRARRWLSGEGASWDIWSLDLRGLRVQPTPRPGCWRIVSGGVSPERIARVLV